MGRDVGGVDLACEEQSLYIHEAALPAPWTSILALCGEEHRLSQINIPGSHSVFIVM